MPTEEDLARVELRQGLSLEKITKARLRYHQKRLQAEREWHREQVRKLEELSRNKTLWDHLIEP